MVDKEESSSSTELESSVHNINCFSFRICTGRGTAVRKEKVISLGWILRNACVLADH